MQPTLLSASSPLVTQEIRYHMPEAGEVFLVWGINGWAVVPEETRPPGTMLKNGVMHTPMNREDDTFVALIQVPSGTTVDYGFLITKTHSDDTVHIWEANGDQGYHTTATKDSVVEVETTLRLTQDQESASVTDAPLITQQIRYRMPEAGEVFLVWGINGWVVVPEETRPPGTTLKNGVMRTPMDCEGDTFVAKVQVPAGATIDYGFLTTRTRRGATTETWDANGNLEQGYHTIAAQESVAEVQAPPSITHKIAEVNRDAGLLRLGLMLATGVCVVLGTAAARMWIVCRSGGTQAKFLGASLHRRQLIYLYDLLRELVVRDMKLRYRRSVLGIIWSLLNPLFQMLVFTFLSRRVLSLQIPNYPPFVFTGVLAWHWFHTALMAATGAIVSSRELIRRPGFPAAILPVVMVTTNMIHFALALPIPLLYFVIRGGRLTGAILTLPLVMMPQFLLILGLGYLAAAFQVTFRDTQHLLGVFLRLLYFLTPVFYDASKISARYQIIYRLNPMFHLITAYRAILIEGTPPDLSTLLALCVLGGALLWIGHIVFKRASYRFVEEL